MYADYVFYVEEYGGVIITDEMEFRRIERKSGQKLDYYTFGRIAQVDDKIRLAVCEMADILFQAEKRKSMHDGLEVISENNDGYSITYAGVNAQDGKNHLEKELYAAAYMYLSQTGLMDWSDRD